MPNSPREWLDHLVQKLDVRWYGTRGLQIYDAYCEGDQTLQFVTRRFRETYGSFFQALCDNYMPLVVDSAAERLKVQGFRFGDSQDADDDAWEIWQSNGMDAQANMVHTEAIKLGMAYWMVAPNGDMPKITCEHPSQVIIEHAAGDRRTRLAALKKWVDGEFIYANVYLPDRVVKYRTTERMLRIERGDRRWATIGATRNPLGVVPIVEVPNNPSMLRGGRSDLAGGVLRVQDAINKFLCDMLIGSEYQAYPQRVLLGVDVPRDAAGNPVRNAELQASQSRLWMFPNSEAKAFEFSASDLENFRKAMDGMIGDLAAQTRIPIYYFRPQAIIEPFRGGPDRPRRRPGVQDERQEGPDGRGARGHDAARVQGQGRRPRRRGDGRNDLEEHRVPFRGAAGRRCRQEEHHRRAVGAADGGLGLLAAADRPNGRTYVRPTGC